MAIDALDRTALQAFLERFARDQATTMHAATVVLGDQLGLYRALAAGGPQTPAELAARSGCQPRLVAEWLGAQAASAYCLHDPVTGRYALTAEQVACLADESSPTFVAGGAQVASVVHKDTERLLAAFTGDGTLGWHEHHHDLYPATDRFFGAVYRANLVPVWVPALDGVEGKLRSMARVADIGCGQGAALILLAQAFPSATFAGFDSHAGSVEAAREAAAAAGVSDRVTFEIAGAEDFPGDGYDLVCVFNALHEWGDPDRAARRIRRALAADGTWMFTEPRAGDHVDDDVDVVGRTFFSASTFVCVPSALSQGAGSDGRRPALGAQAGEATLRQLVHDAGFTRFRRVTQTPAFMVLEARP